MRTVSTKQPIEIYSTTYYIQEETHAHSCHWRGYIVTYTNTFADRYLGPGTRSGALGIGRSLHNLQHIGFDRYPDTGLLDWTGSLFQCLPHLAQAAAREREGFFFSFLAAAACTQLRRSSCRPCLYRHYLLLTPETLFDHWRDRQRVYRTGPAGLL